MKVRTTFPRVEPYWHTVAVSSDGTAEVVAAGPPREVTYEVVGEVTAKTARILSLDAKTDDGRLLSYPAPWIEHLNTIGTDKKAARIREALFLAYAQARRSRPHLRLVTNDETQT